ncbi:MAG: polymer-forming cytoskeletal protein [Candidatus Methylomirabilales bacterium]
MALWKDYSRKEQPPVDADQFEDVLSPSELHHQSQLTESVIAAGLTIEGKIQGAGNLRLAGRFEGNVQVQGDLTIEPGAQITGDLRADTVRLGGEIHGNIYASSRVELLESGSLNGDVTAGSLTVAAGSRMRGKVEFGWDELEADELASNAEGEVQR